SNRDRVQLVRSEMPPPGQEPHRRLKRRRIRRAPPQLQPLRGERLQSCDVADHLGLHGGADCTWFAVRSSRLAVRGSQMRRCAANRELRTANCELMDKNFFTLSTEHFT